MGTGWARTSPHPPKKPILWGRSLKASNATNRRDGQPMDPGHHDEEGQEQRPPLPLNAIIDFGAAAHQGDLQRMRSMIEEQRCDINGVPPAWKSIYQPTPLAYAVWGNQPEAVKLLLEAGADPDHVDGVRRNPSFPRPLSVSARSPSLSPLIAGQQLPSFALGIVQE